MKKLLTLITFKAFLCIGFAQPGYWRQQVNYTIDVHLDDQHNTLNGFIKIRYSNQSPDSLRVIWMHLWPNAYKNDRTAYSEQLLRDGDKRFYFSGDEQKGYINQLDFRVDDIRVEVIDHPLHQDIVQLQLPGILPPGGTITITTPFHVKIPYNFTGEGYTGQTYWLQHWYPRPAVYDRESWHAMPYLNRGDSYSDVADFEVTISLPQNYVVAASGELLDDDEQQWLRQRAAFDWKPIKRRVKQKSGNYKTIVQRYPESAKQVKTLHFRQQNTTDFVWAADKRWTIIYDSMALSNGRMVLVQGYKLPGDQWDYNKLISTIKESVTYFDSSRSAYPFSTLQIIPAKKNQAFSSALFVNPRGGQLFLQTSIAGMISDNWAAGFYAVNTRDYPWLKLGLSNFYGRQRTASAKPQKPSLPLGFIEQTVLQSVESVHKDQPITLSADRFTALNYQLIGGVKAADWLQRVKNDLGPVPFKEALNKYYQHAQAGHPYPADLLENLFGTDSARRLQWEPLLNQKGPLASTVQRKIKISWPGNILSDSAHRNVGIGPALGYNYYDHLMVGAIIHNYSLPPSAFQFVVAPLYASGSRQLNGIGRVSYTTWYPHSSFYKMELGLGAARFSRNAYNPGANENTVYLDFFKLAPYLRLTFNNNALSRRSSYLQLKYYAIQEEGLLFNWDTVNQKTEYRLDRQSRGLGQLKWVVQNDRTLYPYKWDLQYESGNNFGRLAVTGNYFFNYGVHGGLDIRAFAGKFLYYGGSTSQKRVETYRYQLNMTAPKGEEDYTYSNYFSGRSEFEGFFSQQVMKRDGGFKVRTDLLSSKIGRTDDWLAALNFTSSFHPAVPVKLFADVGTYSDAWKTGSNDTRLLFDAGIQLSFFKDLLNIYVPLLYSRVYRDYFRSTPGNDFFQRISFSIDMQDLNFKKIHPWVPL